MCRGLLEAMRRGRCVLLPVLVVLIAVHPAGASHSAAFGGPHAVVAFASPQHQALQGSSGPVFAPQPAHRHDADDHIDHAVDRPRPEGLAAVPEPTGTAVVSLLPVGDPWCGSAVSRRRAGGDEGPSRSADLAMNCVRRQ